VEKESVNITVEDIMTGRSPSKVPDLGPMMTRRQKKTGLLSAIEASSMQECSSAMLKDPKLLDVLNTIAPTELLDEHFEVLTGMKTARRVLF
jgi:hypothetical protein